MKTQTKPVAGGKVIPPHYVEQQLRGLVNRHAEGSLVFMGESANVQDGERLMKSIKKQMGWE